MDDGLVLVRHMAEGLGRLGFAAGILEWARPFLAPMYAWTAAAPGGAVLPLPSVVRLTLTWLVDQRWSAASRSPRWGSFFEPTPRGRTTWWY